MGRQRQMLHKYAKMLGWIGWTDALFLLRELSKGIADKKEEEEEEEERR